LVLFADKAPVDESTKFSGLVDVDSKLPGYIAEALGAAMFK